MNLKLFLTTIAFFFTITFHVFSQNNLPPVQSWNFINNTKVPKERYNVDQEGKIHGTAYTYNQEGELYEISNWNHGKPNGQYILYGNLSKKEIKTKGNYVNGKKDGYWIENYSENGNYKNGIRIGQWSTSGNILNAGSASGQLVNGLKEGEWKGIRHEYQLKISGKMKIGFDTYYKGYVMRGSINDPGFTISLSKKEFDEKYSPHLMKFLENFMENSSYKYSDWTETEVRDKNYSTFYKNGEIVKVMDISSGKDITEMYRKMFDQLFTIQNIQDCDRFLSEWQGEYNILVQMFKTSLISANTDNYFSDFQKAMKRKDFTEAKSIFTSPGIKDLDVFKRTGDYETKIYNLLDPEYSGEIQLTRYDDIEKTFVNSLLGFDLENILKSVDNHEPDQKSKLGIRMKDVTLYIKKGKIHKIKFYTVGIFPSGDQLDICQDNFKKTIKLNTGGKITSEEWQRNISNYTYNSSSNAYNISVGGKDCFIIYYRSIYDDNGKLTSFEGKDDKTDMYSQSIIFDPYETFPGTENILECKGYRSKKEENVITYLPCLLKRIRKSQKAFTLRPEFYLNWYQSLLCKVSTIKEEVARKPLENYIVIEQAKYLAIINKPADGLSLVKDRNSDIEVSVMTCALLYLNGEKEKALEIFKAGKNEIIPFFENQKFKDILEQFFIEIQEYGGTIPDQSYLAKEFKIKLD